MRRGYSDGNVLNDGVPIAPAAPRCTVPAMIRPSPLRAFMLAVALVTSQPIAAQDLRQRVESALQAAGPGTRFGLVVATEDGRELVAIAPNERFIPASNTKMYSSAAAFGTVRSRTGRTETNSRPSL